MFKVFKNVSQGALALSLIATAVMATPGDGIRHQSDKDVMDSIEAALPQLESKTASTTVFGGSAPVQFQGVAQLITDFYRYKNLPEKSYLNHDKQSLQFGGGDNSVFQIKMLVKPGRNTKLWADFGLKASYAGFNDNNWNGTADQTDLEQSHHFGDKGPGVKESLCAGMALRTKVASFLLKGGAMNWEEQSPLSLWHGQPRMFAWEYLPYEIEQPVKQFYKMNIADGERIGRAAWNKKPFQGITFVSENIPGDVYFSMLYGVGNPTDKYERTYFDGAVDLDYAADQGSSVTAQGYGENYKRQFYYRLAKKFKFGTSGNEMTVGFNNGYSLVQDNIMNMYMAESDFAAGFMNQFNAVFQIGAFNSEWQMYDASGNATSKILFNSADNVETLLAADSASLINIGQGYWVEPNVFSLDFKGSINDKFSYMVDVGVSVVDTHKVTIDQSSYSHRDAWFQDNVGFTATDAMELYSSDPSLAPILADAFKGMQSFGAEYLEKEIVKSDPTIAIYSKLGFAPEDSTFKVGMEAIYAAKGFNAPYSFVNSADGYYALGSNMTGPGTFINSSEAAPFSQNSAGVGLSFAPLFKKSKIFGHLKVNYGLNTQLSEARDVLYFPYRLNGKELNASLLSSYNRYGAGLMPGPLEEEDLHHEAKVGDESYEGLHMEYSNPQSGGLRGDYMNSFEGFVAYTQPQDAIMNIMSKSMDIRKVRDLSSVWDHEKIEFADVRGTIADFPVITDGDTTFYTMEVADLDSDNAQFILTDTAGNPVDTIDVKTKSETGFVPVSKKASFNMSVDWGMDISKLFRYKNDLFLSLYYEISGVTKGFSPFAVDVEADDVLLMSHYLRSEPAVALTDEFYLLGLFGYEKWMSGKTWAKNMSADVIASIEKKNIEASDIAVGFGFDWDMMKRVSLHGRYKRYKHTDANADLNNFTGNHAKLELKAFF